MIRILRPHRKKLEELKVIEKKAAKLHQKNIEKIVQGREKADKLVKVIDNNNIILKLANAMGH